MKSKFQYLLWIHKMFNLQILNFEWFSVKIRAVCNINDISVWFGFQKLYHFSQTRGGCIDYIIESRSIPRIHWNSCINNRFSIHLKNPTSLKIPTDSKSQTKLSNKTSSIWTQILSRKEKPDPFSALSSYLFVTFKAPRRFSNKTIFNLDFNFGQKKLEDSTILISIHSWYCKLYIFHLRIPRNF